MVYNCVFWLNSVPHKDGIYLTLIPITIMTGQIRTYDKHCKVEFATHVQLHVKHDQRILDDPQGQERRDNKSKRIC